ncbi:MAG TPA: threonine--tRNA ligase [Myxococcales bacterium]|nr:threonine--tRNA ligase [Myxococcales bacterium]
MAEIDIALPDGSHKQVPAGTTVADFIQTQIGKGLARAALYAQLDGQDMDLSRPLEHGGKLRVITNKDKEGLDLIRHDAAHVMASVVQKLFPGTQVTIGPHTEEGFYYDFFRKEPFTPEDVERIEKAVNEEIRKDLPFVRKEVSREEALQLFDKLGEKFKIEIVEDIFNKGAKTLTLYSHGDWVDFCLGPHAPSTGKIGVVKLLNVAGAYWRGDHRNPQLQRIYGTAFFDKKELDAWLKQQEEARKRDHRRLGKELDLFHFHHFAPGAAFWTDKGTKIVNVLSNAMRNLCLSNGYQEVKTPLMYNKGLWEISGHWGKYRENMFLIQDSETKEHDFSLKPMNCPSHYLLYQMKKHSYRELPLRYHTQDVLHRNEATGVLSGLTRVRQFQQDDAHIFVMESQIADEVKRLTELIRKVYTAFGMEFIAKFGTRPAQRLGEDAMWDRAESALKAAVEQTGVSWVENPGDGAFYGPKLDFQVKDSIGRLWQLGTIQLDYAAPERFGLEYVGEDNTAHRPVVIHRAIYGSFERFIAIMIEHYAGNFPVWLAPVQARVITVSDRHRPFAEEVVRELRGRGLRVELDESSEKLGAKIRDAQIAKLPYTLVVGDKESDARAVSPRRHGEGKDAELPVLPLSEFAEKLAREGQVPY